MIEISDLCFSYSREKKLFSDVRLNIASGGIAGLLGKNGAGKTTLLKLICGLLAPSSGSCTINGFMAATRNPRMLADLCLVPEELYVPAMEMEAYVAVYAPFYPRFSPDLLKRTLDAFELPQRGRLAALSFGQKKKFVLSFAIATQASTLVLDEPTNGFDIPGKTQLRQILADAARDRTIIVSTHQVRDIAELVQRIIVLDNGSIMFNQPMAQVRTNLSYALAAQRPDGGALYCEQVHGGFGVLSTNSTGTDQPVDLEILFNALISDAAAINRLFAPEDHHASR